MWMTMARTAQLLGFILCVALAKAIQVTYLGPKTFPGDQPATFLCQVDPPPANPTDMQVSWFSKGVKVARSVAVENGSFVYNDAPERLQKRFSMSSEQFSTGTAVATIANITIGDDGEYECEADIGRSSGRTRFTIGVFYKPQVSIEAVEGDLDIRPTTPPPTSPTTTTEEPPTGSIEPTSSSSTTSTTVSTSTQPDGPVQVAIAKCIAVGAYPKPTTFRFSKFTKDQTGSVWPDVSAADVVENADGTFNATATLRTEVTRDLDQATIRCEVSLQDEHKFESAGETPPYTVRYLTSKVEVRFSQGTPTEGNKVTIDCRADGNPPPTKTLIPPVGEPIDVTNGPHVINAVGRQQAGTYSCEASNSNEAEDLQRDSGRLRVLYLNQPVLESDDRMSADKSTMTMRLGESSEIVCIAAGKPTARYVWTKDGHEVAAGARLVLTNVDYTHRGKYECTAKGAWDDHTSFTLDVQGGCPVEFAKDVMASKTPGKAAYKLTCTSKANPRCEVKINNAGGEEVASGTGVAILLKDEVDMQINPLKFSCTASNSINVTQAGIIVDEAPVCCGEPKQAGGLGVGVIIIIVIIVLLVVVGVPVACYCIKKRNEPSSPPEKTANVEEDEKDKLKPDDVEA